MIWDAPTEVYANLGWPQGGGGRASAARSGDRGIGWSETSGTRRQTVPHASTPRQSGI